VYDGSTCLETFLASVRNFATYYHWTTRDELFHLKGSLKGPAGQLLWDLGSDISLEKLKELLKRPFGGADQEERFRMELCNRRRRPKEDLPSLYSDIRRMLSLAYPGPDPSNVKETVGRDAFMDALGDPELRARILERGVPTMDDALRTAMSLDILDKSKENYKKTWRSYEEPFEDEPRRKKERRLAVNSVETVEGGDKSEHSEVTVTQLQRALASC